MTTVFSKIINKSLPAEIIYEDDQIIAFKDKFPQRPGHFLVLPKKPYKDLQKISNDELSYLMIKARELALTETKKLGVTDFNLIVNSGQRAGQEVMHLHIHVIPAQK